MAQKAPAFEITYRNYLNQISRLDLKSRCEMLGAQMDQDALIIPFFGKPYRVSASAVADADGRQPIHAASVVLCKYVILCPDIPPPDHSEWVSYRNFKDAAPFAEAFSVNTERAIAKNFSLRRSDLENACKAIGGRSASGQYSYDLAVEFTPLPKISLLLLFNDADEEFPAQASVLFQRYTPHFLDMECLAIIGWLLADELNRAAGNPHPTIM